MSSASQRTAPGATSRFALSLIDILDRLHYRRVSPQEQFDPVYRLRYEAYRREEFIPINSQQMTRDVYDDAENCHCFGIYIDDQLVSSIRLHIATAQNPTSPSASIWPDVLGDIIAKGGSYIDPSRFTADHDASLAFPALPYLTLRTAVMACAHFNSTYCISSVRPEHVAFYKRVFGSEQLAGEGYWGELTFPVCLFASYIPVMLPRVLQRYPFFDSTEEERQALFDTSSQAKQRIIRPTARLAQTLRQHESETA